MSPGAFSRVLGVSYCLFWSFAHCSRVAREEDREVPKSELLMLAHWVLGLMCVHRTKYVVRLTLDSASSSDMPNEIESALQLSDL